jgi:hypothetical protein
MNGPAKHNLHPCIRPNSATISWSAHLEISNFRRFYIPLTGELGIGDWRAGCVSVPFFCGFPLTTYHQPLTTAFPLQATYRISVLVQGQELVSAAEADHRLPTRLAYFCNIGPALFSLLVFFPLKKRHGEVTVPENFDKRM